MDTTSYKVTLEKLLATITSELKDIAVYNPETDDWQVTTDGAALSESDTDLQADAAEAADARVTELAELENQYKATTRALTKIAAGTYGICEISGEPIEEARLAANPSARTCITHKEDEYQLPL